MISRVYKFLGPIFHSSMFVRMKRKESFTADLTLTFKGGNMKTMYSGSSRRHLSLFIISTTIAVQDSDLVVYKRCWDVFNALPALHSATGMVE